MADAPALDRTFASGGAEWQSTMLGMFLSDSELVARLEDTDLITGLDVGEGDDRFGADAPVQPCSVDLTIGGIFIPGTQAPRPGSAGVPSEGTVLGPGRTAVITTLEKCNLPDDVGAIGFPPNSVSSKGILMTNPGHVDPGYRGPMSFTVINMGSDDYLLMKGRKIVTLLFFKLGTAAHRDLHARGKSEPDVKGLLGVLAPDFLGIRDRVREAAESEENKTRRRALLTPIVVGFVGVVGAVLLSVSPLQREVSDLKASTAAMGDVEKLEKEVEALQDELDREGLRFPVGAEGK